MSTEHDPPGNDPEPQPLEGAAPDNSTDTAGVPPPATVPPTENTVTINGVEYRCPYWDLLPGLAADDLNGLRNSIEEKGVINPVTVTGDGVLIDGYHRATIANEFGKEVEVDPVDALTPEAERTYALTLNLHRRHLTTAQKQKLVDQVLILSPADSNRKIAELVKVDPKTVAEVRTKKETAGEIPHQEDTIGRDGKRHPRKPGKPKPAAVKGGAGTWQNTPSTDAQPQTAECDEIDAQASMIVDETGQQKNQSDRQQSLEDPPLQKRVEKTNPMAIDVTPGAETNQIDTKSNGCKRSLKKLKDAIWGYNHFLGVQTKDTGKWLKLTKIPQDTDLYVATLMLHAKYATDMANYFKSLAVTPGHDVSPVTSPIAHAEDGALTQSPAPPEAILQPDDIPVGPESVPPIAANPSLAVAAAPADATLPGVPDLNS